jgi:hypothetical protein
MIRLRIDVDYPYPSRMRSFFSTALKSKIGKNYLQNSKTIAKMINESPREIKAYWFFTPQTVPDRELLELLNQTKHEIGLHVANDPYPEIKLLEEATKRKLNYYTIHGTARLLTQIMWRRKLGEREAPIPNNFPLKPFHKLPTVCLDVLCYHNSDIQVLNTLKTTFAEEKVLEIHPEWLFQRGKLNHRGSYYNVLKKILDIDEELETLSTRKKGFARIARDTREYERDVAATGKFLEKLSARGIDIFTFIERGWCCKIPDSSKSWLKTEDNIALLRVAAYSEWWEKIGKKTRNMVRKAEKAGVRTEVVEPSEKLAEGIWKIYNETPIRQERAFPHYGLSLQSVRTGVLPTRNSTFIGAFFQDELAGFVQLVNGDNIAIVSQILALQKYGDKAVNNVLLAKAVEVTASKQVQWLMYGRMGNHPSLDSFKQSNGFTKFSLTRYYIPLTKRGRLLTRLGMHKEMKDALPQAVKDRIIPVFNWVSRTKMKARLALR